ncbi:hypothetical protein Avbf_06329 [Armadillidium vulgare]|nr:hypothetical protein Avbf_06329 [Armadillidium vulgare]
MIGYCEPSDAVCRKAWTECYGAQKARTYMTDHMIIQKQLWGGFIHTANKCLKKYGEEPIGITFPNEDPHGGAPGGPDQFHGILQLRLKKITNPETIVNVECCYVERTGFVKNKTKINEMIFTHFAKMKFPNKTQVLESYLKAIETCKTTPIKDCDLVPFRDCIYKTCIAEVRKQLQAERRAEVQSVFLYHC